MSNTTDFFDHELLKGLEAIYKTDDLITVRRERVEALQLDAGERVIDIGAGPGFMALEMSRAVGLEGKVLGVDNNDVLVERARQRCAAVSHVEFELADATQLPVPNESFDVAVSTQVFEYVPDVDSAIAETYRVLCPGGRGLIVATDWGAVIWNSSDSQRMARVLSAFDEHCAHRVLPRTLTSRLESAGFTVDDVRARPQFNPTYDPGSFSMVLAGMVRSFVSGRNGISEDEAIAWLDDLHHVGQLGDYFFCLNQFMFAVTRPTSD